MRPRGMQGCWDASLKLLRTRFCKHHWLPHGSALSDPNCKENVITCNLEDGTQKLTLSYFMFLGFAFFHGEVAPAIEYGRTDGHVCINMDHWRMGRPKAWPTPAREAMEDVRWCSVDVGDCRSEIAPLSPVSSFTCSLVIWLLSVSYCIILYRHIYIYIIVHLPFHMQYDRLDVDTFLLPRARLYKPYN